MNYGQRNANYAIKEKCIFHPWLNFNEKINKVLIIENHLALPKKCPMHFTSPKLFSNTMLQYRY